MKKPVTLTLAALTLAAATLTAQDAVEMTKPLVYKNDQGESLPYRIYLPSQMPLKPMPAVIFLHGAGERGEDNTVQVKHAVRELITYSINNEPMMIIAPQCPLNKKWAEVDWSKLSHTQPEEISFAMRMTLEILEQLCKDYPVDTHRLYITGLSMGGYGTWDIIQRFPAKFAAAMPVCGGGDVAGAPLFKDLPIWAFHGDQDGAVPVSRSRDMVAALKACGSKVKYTEYPGVGHNCWSQTYADQNVLKWFFSQKK